MLTKLNCMLTNIDILQKFTVQTRIQYSMTTRINFRHKYSKKKVIAVSSECGLPKFTDVIIFFSTVHRSSTFIHFHDQGLGNLYNKLYTHGLSAFYALNLYSDSPVENVFHKEYATQGATPARPTRKKIHSNVDNDEGYKSDSNSRLPRIRHREIDSDLEHHYHRRRRSRRRPTSVDALVGERHAKTVVETKEKSKKSFATVF